MVKKIKAKKSIMNKSISGFLKKMIMSKAKYLIRLDDACETQDESKWSAIERLLNDFDIKPIVAVIPCNSDTSLHFDKENKNFWKKVKIWEKKGWTIAPAWISTHIP